MGLMMKLTRRRLLATASASMVPRSVFASPDMPPPRTLTASEGQVQLVTKDYGPTPIWGFDGQVPGPEIRVRQGARVRRQVVNALKEPTSVHWHGIRIANAMDGVPGMTQDLIQPAAHFDYDFVAPDAGTYWYHSHNRSWEQTARGLYGPLIIEEPVPPDVDDDLVLTLDDWRLAPDATIAGGFGNLMDASHGGRIGNFVTVNSDPDHAIGTAAHARLRLRLINTATARIFQVGGRGITGHVIALDGMPLAEPAAFDGFVTLAPAQRADLVVDLPATADAEPALISRERDGDYILTRFLLTGTARRAPQQSPVILPPNRVAPLDLDGAMRVTLSMDGGAMVGLTGATADGRQQSMRELAGQGLVWALNNHAGMPDAPLFLAERGRTMRITLRNQTRFPHGIHLHGHHFHEMINGRPGPLRDTTLLQPRETRDIAFVADNPGKWLLHCHMLDHQAAGMKTWFQVA